MPGDIEGVGRIAMGKLPIRQTPQAGYDVLPEYREEHVARMVGEVKYPAQEPSEIEKMCPEDRPKFAGQT